MKTKIMSASNFMSASLATGIVITALAAGGCSKTVYVPVENNSIVRDFDSRQRLSSDTLYIRDSVTTIVKGDTMIREIVRDRNRIVWHRDTIEKQHTDTIVKNIIVPPADTSTKQRFQTLKSLLTTISTIIAGVLMILFILSASWRILKKRSF